jgi:hypothetical protein
MPRAASTTAASVAALGLAVVVICLAAFSIFAAYTTQTQVNLAQDMDARHEGFSRVVAAVSSLQIAELEYRLEATAQHRATSKPLPMTSSSWNMKPPRWAMRTTVNWQRK